ncbi:hypothetical protein V8C40DRAFT_238296 [Trichoderma camerunense]
MSRLYVPKSSKISIWSAPIPIRGILRCIQHHAPLHTSISSPRSVAINLDPSYCTGISFFFFTRL